MSPEMLHRISLSIDYCRRSLLAAEAEGYATRLGIAKLELAVGHLERAFNAAQNEEERKLNDRTA